MASRRAELGELETLVLLAVLRLERKASGRAVREEIITRGGRPISRGATYATISRLEYKGLLAHWIEHPAPTPGGRARRHFTLTPKGLGVLRTAQRHLLQMRAGLESILDAS